MTDAHMAAVPSEMTAPRVRKVSELVGAGEPMGRTLAFDPGGTTAYASFTPWTVTQGRDVYSAGKAPLDDVPYELAKLGLRWSDVVAAESYNLRAPKARQQAGSAMPASQGIGMLRMACYAAGAHLYMVPPGAKRAGRAALDAGGQAARAACRSEHERDAVDLLGFVLREMRRTAPTKRSRP